jgi:hypothetical protein
MRPKNEAGRHPNQRATLHPLPKSLKLRRSRIFCLHPIFLSDTI